MELTKRQEEGLKIAVAKYRAGDKYTVISGYAGTGKSTLVKYIVQALHTNPDKICYAAYTGKACQVLLSKGNKNVTTLHKLLYKNIQQRDGSYLRVPKESLDYSIVIADECSMIPNKFVELLLLHNVFVIFLGDPFQLKPISDDGDNHLLDHPDVFLDQIMRQAEDNEIIQLSMKIRNYEPVDYYVGKDAIVLPKEDLTTGHMLWADQILCATNKTRTNLNMQMRDLLGHHGAPGDGDKVICVKNDWDRMAKNDDPLVNGTIGYIKNTFETTQNYPAYLFPLKQIKILGANFVSDTGADFGNLLMDRDMILYGRASIDPPSQYKIRNNKKYRHTLPQEFLYGYAITTHKAQGSQWDKILLIEENFPFDKEEHARWLYTGVTRAISKIVLVR